MKSHPIFKYYVMLYWGYLKSENQVRYFSVCIMNLAWWNNTEVSGFPFYKILKGNWVQQYLPHCHKFNLFCFQSLFPPIPTAGNVYEDWIVKGYIDAWSGLWNFLSYKMIHDLYELNLNQGGLEDVGKIWILKENSVQWGNMPCTREKKDGFLCIDAGNQ